MNRLDGQAAVLAHDQISSASREKLIKVKSSTNQIWRHNSTAKHETMMISTSAVDGKISTEQAALVAGNKKSYYTCM